jgi:hypothetical protein
LEYDGNINIYSNLGCYMTQRIIEQIGNLKPTQNVGVLVDGKVYPIFPLLEEVNIDGTKFTVLLVDTKTCIGEPNEEDDSASIFASELTPTLWE